jgi:alpha-L-rhamnosidase
MKTAGIMAMISGLLFGLISGSWAVTEQAEHFISAKPIWPKDRETEMNLQVGFRAIIEAPVGEKVVLRVAAASIYRAWINGQFLGCGPARGPHGYFRVDQWDLSGMLNRGKNLIAVEVAGYNVNSYYLLDQPSMFQAEVVAGDRVLASTGGAGEKFTARVLDYRVQKVQRFSFQRTFAEVYRLAPGFDSWRQDVASVPDAAVETAVLPEKHLLPRRVLYPDFTIHRPIKTVIAGRVEPIEQPKNLWRASELTNIGPQLKGFRETELATNPIPSIEAQCLRSIQTASPNKPYSATDAISLAAREYRILDIGVDRTGFIGAKVTCSKKTRLWFVFDEILSDNDVDFKRLVCINIISYELEPGTYQLEGIEPYSLRYLKTLCLEGECRIENVYVREYAHPQVSSARFTSSDDRLNRLFAAGVETFRQNAIDIFTDSASRERAGWPCDSFFTARVAFDLNGNTPVERNYFENFLLPAKFENLPDGMFPMCYPADHYNGVYIPNWALWLVLQLEEYYDRSGDQTMADAFQPKIRKLFDFFKQYENQDGLLEKLPSWVFVEWSDANNFLQDVNYPSNMLYARVLKTAGRLYKDPELLAKAERIRETIRRQSFDGQFFVDNAVRDEDGKLQVNRNRSEVCQYYAFFFDVATPKSHPELWQLLLNKFGPNRHATKAFADVHRAEWFVGNLLRLELLSQAGRNQQILDESVAYLLYMADRTGTLWEYTSPHASCSHGFASHIVHTLYRDVLGLRHVDPLNHKVDIQFGDATLEYCDGILPTPDGDVHLRWQQAGDRIEYQLNVPTGYEVTITNHSGKELSAK